MQFSRRHILKSSSAYALGSGLLLSGCSGAKPAKNAETERRYVINANMVIEPNFDEPLSQDVKAKLRATGLTAIKQSLGGSQGTYEQTIEMLESIDTIFDANPDVFRRINSAADLDDAYDTGRLGIIYSFEAATMLESNPDRVAEFSAKGVRIMQPGYNNTNSFGAGVMSTEEPLGLTKLGHKAIEAMEASHVLVDLSHAHEDTARDVLNTVTKPPSITHSGCFAVNPHQRNKSDAQLKGVADKGGVFGLYEMSYITPDLEQQSMEAFMAHLTHAINTCGEDHVGIGSDTPVLGFDTGPESMAMWNEINQHRKDTGVAAPGEGPPPYVVGINGPHKMSGIADQLKKRGVKAAAIDKIMGQNFARLFKDVW